VIAVEVETRRCRKCGEDLDDIGWYFDPCPADDEGSHSEARQYAARSLQAVRRLARWAVTAGHTARYLWAVRAAIPWPVKVILAVAMALKCLPLDFLADETLTVIAAVILNRTRPGLLKACLRAAQIRA
jgi:hypothetical protein